MNNEELILERLERLENHIAPMVSSAKSIEELRDELSPRVNEAVQALIVQLADVESDFQIEDLLFLIKNAMRNVNNFSFMLDQMKNIIDFVLTAEPLMKATVPQIIYYLENFEQKGLFKLMNTGIETLTKISETYTPEAFEQIADGVVRLLGIVKKLTDPKALDLLDKAAEIPSRIDLEKAKPVGPFGMMWAMGSSESRNGLGVLIELTKGLGAMKEQPADAP